MSSPDNLNDALKEILARLNLNTSSGISKKSDKKECSGGTPNSINPSQAIIIGGLLAGVLEVTSVLVDRNQTVQIVLSGSLKKKTELEILLDQIGSRPFDEVIKTMLGRL